MRPSRRQLLALAASRALAQEPRRDGPKPRSTPSVCLYSQALIKVPYDDLGPILKSLEVDGCDLSVQPGGHVKPETAGLDMMRSIEAITGVGLDVPVITTAYTNLADPTIRNVLGFSGQMGVPIFRAGFWKYNPAGDIEPRLMEVQRDMLGLAAIAKAVSMAVVFQNLTGDSVGASVWDLYNILRGIDPRSAGFDFDIGYATQEGAAGGWATSLRLALPRIRMIAARDFNWVKDANGAMKPVPCALGEGVVNWPELFRALARVRFTGPVSIQFDYKPKDEMAAIKRDIAFVRKQVSAAYGG